jgi:LPS-assembly protein
MFRQLIKRFINSIFILMLFTSMHIHAASISDISLPDEEILDLLESGPDWMPKPYKTPIEQGVLLDTENLSKVIPGLSKEQVRFLLGTPTIIDLFHVDRWDYIFYERTEDGFTDPKRITVVFKNEKVGEVYNQDKLIKKMGIEIESDYTNAPVDENIKITNEENLFQEIIIAKRTDYLIATKKNKLPVCIDDEFEDYLSQKTLYDADEETLEVRSDKQNQDEDGIFYASGNVEIERANDLIKSDKANFNADTGVLAADGNVKYLTEDLSLYAKKGGYNSQNDTVSFSATKYKFPSQKRPGRGESDNIFIDDEGIVYLTPSSYTTCALDDPDWELASSKIILHRDTDRGHAYNILLKYKSVPVLYSPFFSFPLSSDRHTGFLLPSIGSSGESGTVISTPYYFNIAENMDFTFTPTNYSGRGVMIDGQFRYKGSDSNTEIEFTHMDKDDIKGESRHAYSLRDNRVFKNTLVPSENGRWSGSLITSNVDIGGISDLTFLDDFGNSVSRIGRTHITREIKLNRIDYGELGYLNSSVRATDYQLVKKDLQEQYSVLPQARVEYATYEKNNSFNYKLEGELSVFDHTYASKATGTRLMLYPSVEYPIKNIGWELTPKFGVKHRSYSLSGNSKNSISDTTPIISLRGKMIFDKMQTKDILQTLEPEMYFLYIPASNQDDIPIFDAGDNDLKYNLFSENRFYGQDRLNDAKQLTLALTSSIVDTSSGNELIRGTLGQIFYLDDRSVNLNDSVTSHTNVSNILGLVSARLSDHLRLTGYSEFNPHRGYGEKNQVRLSYKRPYGKQNQIFNSSYRFTRGTQEEVDFSAVIPVNNKLSLVGKINYSFNNRRSSTEDTLEKMFGFEYESCCYGIKFVMRDYWNGNKTDNAFYFEFLPKGIATSTNKTAELLREGILGYQDVFNY